MKPFDAVHPARSRRTLQSTQRILIHRRMDSATSRGMSAPLIGQINPVLRGWFAYFKYAQARTFRMVDGFVRRRLRSILRKQLARIFHRPPQK